MAELMKAIRLDETGPPSNLRCVETERPVLAADGVLIRVAYAGVIYADAEARRGTYYRKTALPWFPGREAAGIVEAVGPAVTAFKPGDRVAALVMGGGCYGEYVQARAAPHRLPAGGDGPPSDIVALPDEVRFTQALVYLVNFRLAHILFHAWARTPPQARIMVHGAAGGMGAMLLLLASLQGCETIAIVRNAAEVEFCRRLGATHAIDASQQDYVAAVETIGGGVHFSFNGVGGDTINRDPPLLAPFGELICYGYVAGKQPFDFFGLDRTLSIKSFNADNFIKTPHFAVATTAMHEQFRRGALLDAGRIFPLSQAAEAHQALESGDFLGKIVLQP